ncbi:hypothetical protein DL240_05000 [Lujinxingia litoralis]|uniref:Transglycosylase SLT domain-containing protein n=1 Tax=Lujinxingia litoralis TaxID=2211119 RepID=A0A328CCB8_9DELT|nr:transglycosylase SLT domain-containing protein [Lujinxingia litoralis]RAL23521.1 hypothetical protein DL240_05000 [Lujinxingia litoralis]
MTSARLHPMFLAVTSCVGAFFSPTASAQDIIDQNLPAVACTAPSCEAAFAALANNDHAQAARHFVDYAETFSSGPERQPWQVKAAYAYERAGLWKEATRHYAQAARAGGELQNYLWTQAARAQAQVSLDDPIIDEILASGALAKGYEEGALTLARIEAARAQSPSPETTAAMLTSGPTDEACSWLLDLLVRADATPSVAELTNRAYAVCIAPEYDAQFARLTFTPSPDSRRERADRLFSAVRFQDARTQLDALDLDALSPVDQCKARFRQARTLFRLKQAGRAEELYRKVVDECVAPENEDERVRSLYAVGNRNYHRGRLEAAEAFFNQLLNDYPARSHADDALFYLARIARKRENPQQELNLLKRALSDYPTGDMVHELVWEVHEALYRSGNYSEFIDRVTSLPLPEHDAQYFSQGRLEYFVGQAYRHLGRIAQAERYLQRAWVKYPFSFYGYLSHLRLLELDLTPEPLSPSANDTRVDWFQGEFATSGAGVLARAGHFEGACDYERARQHNASPTETERWRLAALCHRAERFPLSHNIARRTIPGRPWALPRQGRVARWQVAWPNPFVDLIVQAVDAERAQAPSVDVHPGFPASIMREESSFIEDVISWAGAHGLMQLMPATALDHDNDIEGNATPERLLHAEVNIRVGVDHIFTLASRFEGHPVLMAASYNAGAGRINGWLRRQPNDEIALWVEDIPFLETRDYSKRVVGTYAAYQWMQGQRELDPRIAKPAR